MMNSLPLLALLLAATHLTTQQYSFAIHNNLAVDNRPGAVHTWLSFKEPGMDVKYFNFTASTLSSARGLKPAPGNRAQAKPMLGLLKKLTTEKYTGNISQNQYESMLREIDSFYSSVRLYSLFSREMQNTYNDVTACNGILRAGGVYLLEDIVDPSSVSVMIKQTKSRHKRGTKKSQKNEIRKIHKKKCEGWIMYASTMNLWICLIG